MAGAENTIGCLGKIGYGTRAEADDAKRRLFKRRDCVRGGKGHTATGLQTYHCAKCGRFHLGRNKLVGVKADRRKGIWLKEVRRYRELTK